MIFQRFIVCLLLSVPGTSATLRGRRLDKQQVCVNSVAEAEVDEGCSSDLPICVLGDDTIPAIHTAGEKCIKCEKRKGAAYDLGCSHMQTICIGDDGENRECVKCVNTSSGAARDNGCSYRAPICTDGFGDNIQTDSGGDVCAVCINDNPDPLGKDTGCNDRAHPICLPAEGEFDILDEGKAGFACGPAPPCVNNRPSDETDKGCKDTAPICIMENGSQPEPNKGGHKCHGCMNTAPYGGWTDTAIQKDLSV